MSMNIVGADAVFHGPIARRQTFGVGAGIPEKIDVPQQRECRLSLTPVLSLTIAGVDPAEAVNSSVRVMTIFTGLWLFSANAIATGSRRGSILPPKPPPTLVQIIRILLSGTPNRLAITVRNSKTSWEQVQTVTVPPTTAAVVACGSI